MGKMKKEEEKEREKEIKSERVRKKRRNKIENGGMVAFWLSGDDAQHVQDALIFSTIFGIGKKQAQLPIISDIFI